MRGLDIARFSLELDELIERTNGEVSYLELIGVLESTKHRLIQEFFEDDGDDEEDPDDEDDED